MFTAETMDHDYDGHDVFGFLAGRDHTRTPEYLVHNTGGSWLLYIQLCWLYDPSTSTFFFFFMIVLSMA